MKHLHRLTYNSLGKKPYVFTYQFGNTKDVTIQISKNAVSINADLNKLYDPKEMASNKCYLFPDAIKKALLLHILLYSKIISIKTISVQIDGDESKIEVSDNNKPYCLISAGSLERKIPSCWNNPQIIQNILKQTQSSADSRTAALFAYVYSKDKQFETERFMYLWMAFNGLYNYLSKQIPLSTKKRIRTEWEQILFLQKFFNIGKATIREEDKSRIAHEVVALIKKQEQIRICDLKEIKENNLPNQIQRFLVKQNGDPYDLTALGYVLTQLTYYYRCNLFHASKPMALISFADENRLVILRILNNLLEEFLDENLPKWFDDNYIENNVKPFVQTCINSK